MLTDSGTPKHLQLRALLEDGLDERSPGELIASERALMAEHGVSRSTVRAAIDALVVAGRVRRVHGKGTVVVRPRVESHLHLASFTQDMRRRGHRPSTRVLSLDDRVPPVHVAEALDLGAGEHAWRLERLRLADDVPMAHEVSWYPIRVLPGLDAEDVDGSIYALMTARYGVVVDAAVQRTWSDLCDRALCALLEVRPPSSALLFERVASARGELVEHTTSAYRGDRYRIQTTLGHHPHQHHDPEGSR